MIDRKQSVDWEDLRHFVALAAAGSLSAAARKLATTHATVARRVSRLEERLGGKLFDRRGGLYKLSPLGVEMLSHAAPMSRSALAVEQIASGVRRERPKVRISVARTMGGPVPDPSRFQRH